MRLSDLLRLYLTATPLAASTRYLVRRSIERVIETLGDREIREIDDAAVLLLRQTLDASGVPSRAEASCKWLRARREFFVYFRLLCQQAGLPVERRRLQLTHRLRRTTITAAAQRSLDAAQKNAGHASLATTLRSYIDPRRIQGEVPVPPIARARDRRRA